MKKISTRRALVFLFFGLLVDVVFTTSTNKKRKKPKTSTANMMDRLSRDDISKKIGKQIRHKKSSYDVHDGSLDEEVQEGHGSVEDDEDVVATCNNGARLPRIPTDPDDFDEPAWMDIIELAFPPWEIDQDECGRLTRVDDGQAHSEYPMAARIEGGVGGGGKWNPCYYTKRFDGLDPVYGGYPTPIDTRYPYAFAAPFYGQPGDGSAHHCNMDVSAKFVDV
jgi:hypothetical protein